MSKAPSLWRLYCWQAASNWNSSGQQLEQFRRDAHRVAGSLAVHLAPLAIGLIVRKHTVQLPYFVEGGFHGGLHLIPVVTIDGNGIGGAHGLGALFQAQQLPAIRW